MSDPSQQNIKDAASAVDKKKKSLGVKLLRFFRNISLLIAIGAGFASMATLFFFPVISVASIPVIPLAFVLTSVVSGLCFMGLEFRLFRAFSFKQHNQNEQQQPDTSRGNNSSVSGVTENTYADVIMVTGGSKPQQRFRYSQIYFRTAAIRVHDTEPRLPVMYVANKGYMPADGVDVLAPRGGFLASIQGGLIVPDTHVIKDTAGNFYLPVVASGNGTYQFKPTQIHASPVTQISQPAQGRDQQHQRILLKKIQQPKESLLVP